MSLGYASAISGGIPSAASGALSKAQSQRQLLCFCLKLTYGAIAILVDDGIATGMMAVAAQALERSTQQQSGSVPQWLTLSLLPWLQQWGDRIIVLETLVFPQC